MSGKRYNYFPKLKAVKINYQKEIGSIATTAMGAPNFDPDIYLGFLENIDAFEPDEYATPHESDCEARAGYQYFTGRPSCTYDSRELPKNSSNSSSYIHYVKPHVYNRHEKKYEDPAVKEFWRKAELPEKMVALDTYLELFTRLAELDVWLTEKENIFAEEELQVDSEYQKYVRVFQKIWYKMQDIKQEHDLEIDIDAVFEDKK